MSNDRIYILSDLHINLLSPEKSAELLHFFKHVVSRDAVALYLNGDIVDLMESGSTNYPNELVISFFAVLKEMAGRGIPVHYNLGNHDLPLLLLFPDFKKPEGQFIDIHSEHKPVEIMPNIFLHYRTIQFTHGHKKVYLEHSHIYDLGWVPGSEWNQRWIEGGKAALTTDFVENIRRLRNIFNGGGEDYHVRILRTGSHLPAPLYASHEARRIAIDDSL